MQSGGEIRIDPARLGRHPVGTDPHSAPLELVLPYTDTALARASLQRAALLSAGLLVSVTLVAVHVVPFPADFHCPSSEHAFLVNELMGLAAESPLPVSPQVVLARSRDEGFRYALPPESTVLVGTYRHLWRTGEERLARRLAADGHNVALLRFEPGKLSL